MFRYIPLLFTATLLSACSTPKTVEYEPEPSPIVEQNIFVTSWGEPINLETIECIEDWVPFVLRTKQHTGGRRVSIVKCVPPKA